MLHRPLSRYCSDCAAQFVTGISDRKQTKLNRDDADCSSSLPTCLFLAAMESMNCLVLFSGSVGELTLGETEALWSPTLEAIV